jgi:hypothetical protein
VADEGGKADKPDDPSSPQTDAGRTPFGLTPLGISVLILLVVGAPALFILGQYQPPPTTPENTVAADASAANASAANVANVATSPAPMPAAFSQDDVATAFAVVYGSARSETDAQGSTLALTPRRLLPVKDNIAALISEGVRDRGPDGTPCQDCSGDLRIDYLVWNGSGFSLPAKPTRLDEAGASRGSPPAWKLVGGPGLPTLSLRASSQSEGCVAMRTAVIKLTPAGAVQTSEKRHDDCSAAEVPPPPPPPPIEESPPT